jgi:hypothetical protein
MRVAHSAGTRSARYNLVYAYFAGMVREESGDYTVMAERVLEGMREWLEEHQNALTR